MTLDPAGPRIGTPRSDRATLGEAWSDVMFNLGFEPHVWQQHRADVMYELVPRPDGLPGRRLAARVSGTMVGRQAGKTAAAGGDVVLRMMAPDLPELRLLIGHEIGPQHIVFTAQDRQSAKDQWEEHVRLIMASPYAAHVVNGKPTMTHGSECLRFDNGSHYEIATPSKDGVRGRSIDLAIIDEALTHEAWLLDALAPTMAQRDGARNSFGAQLVVISNAGDETSTLLNLQRELGRRAVGDGDRRRMWLEYSCADDDDPLDPAVWARVMPTYEQPDGISRDLLELQAETLGTDAFAREYLCKTVWSQERQLIAVDDWAELPYVQTDVSPVVAVEVGERRDSATIVSAAVVGDHVGVRVLEQRPGVDWVLGYVAALGATVVVDRGGPAASLISPFEQVVPVLAATSRDVADAAAGLVDAVAVRRVGHTGDPRFQDAVPWLGRRKRGDRWVFDRSRGDVSSIVAASLALWALDAAMIESAAVY